MNKFKRRALRVLAGLLAGTALLLLGIWLFVKIPPLRQAQTLRILDRRGNELYQYLGQEKIRSSWLPLSDISPWLIRATLFKEDRHFYRHPGINPFTLARALAANVKSGRVVQGGSTISMQLAKMLRQRRKRSFWEKANEMLLTVKLEMKLGKREILNEYMNRVYYGNQLFGCQAAAQAYFGKPARDLSLAQSALLATITSAPSSYNPYTRLPAIRKKARQLLDQMQRRGWIGSEEYEIALAEEVSVLQQRHPLQAPHFVLSLLAGEENIYGTGEIWTALDLEMQEETEQALRGFISMLRERGVKQGAVLVMDNRDAEILAWVGSTDFWNQADSGMIDGCTIRRQPGSALKPFLYCCGLQKGLQAASILPDLAATFRDGEKLYVPRNYTGRFSGPQRLRVALASSLNVPAVHVLTMVGKGKFYEFLHQAGFSSLDRGDQHYGLGLALGSGEVTLLELVRAYSSLARGGLVLPERRILRLRAADGSWLQPERPQPRRICDPRIAFVISSILSDDGARGAGFSEDSPLRFPYQVAVKTGTSEGFRDNFCIGYTADYTVGVWVGNFEGKSMHNVSGVTGAGPVFHAVMNLVYRRMFGGVPYGYHSLAATPAGVVTREICPLSGLAAAADCPGKISELFLAGTFPEKSCDWHRSVEIDGRNLLQASSATPVRFRERRLFYQFPPTFREWAVHSGYPFPPLLRSELPEHEFQISYPVDRSIFQHLADLPALYQSLRLKLKTSLRGQRVVWRVDDRPIARVGFPFSAIWRIQTGMHEITAESADGKWRDRIRIVVQ